MCAETRDRHDLQLRRGREPEEHHARCDGSRRLQRPLRSAAATFDGLIDTTAVLVKYTDDGDTDFSGKVNFDDYVRTDSLGPPTTTAPAG